MQQQLNKNINTTITPSVQTQTKNKKTKPKKTNQIENQKIKIICWNARGWKS